MAAERFSGPKEVFVSASSNLKVPWLPPRIVNAPGRCFGDTSLTPKVYALQLVGRKEKVASTPDVSVTAESWCSVLPVLHFAPDRPLGVLDMHDDIFRLQPCIDTCSTTKDINPV